MSLAHPCFQGINLLLVGSSTIFGGPPASKNRSTAAKHAIVEVDPPILALVYTLVRRNLRFKASSSETSPSYAILLLLLEILVVMMALSVTTSFTAIYDGCYLKVPSLRSVFSIRSTSVPSFLDAMLSARAEKIRILGVPRKVGTYTSLQRAGTRRSLSRSLPANAPPDSDGDQSARMVNRTRPIWAWAVADMASQCFPSPQDPGTTEPAPWSRLTSQIRSSGPIRYDRADPIHRPSPNRL